jgi:hypothetical protein
MTERRARMRYDADVNATPAHEVRLKDRTPRGRAKTGAGCAILFSLPFIVAGVALTGGGLGLWPLKGEANAPPWIIAATGSVFAAAGLLVFWSGIAQVRENARCAGLLRSRPGEPWLADYPWSARSANDRTLQEAVGTLVGSAFFALFLAPFNWWAFVSSHGNLFVVAVVSLFDLVNLLILGQGAYLLIRHLKYGASTLVFRRFPFFLGDTVDADFRTPADVRQLKRLVFTLRCIREQVDAEAKGSGLNLAVYEVWKEERIVEPPAREIPVSFRLPVEAHFSTELPIVTPRYWELEVTGEAPGVDFGARFLVPVYADPSAQA